MPDLEYFLSSLTDARYRYEPLLAPSNEMLDAFKRKQLTWLDYENSYLALLADRKVSEQVSLETLDGGCLLCSEDKPDRCHRRLAAEFLRDGLREQSDITIIHL